MTTTHHPTFAAGSAVLDQLRAEERLEQLQDKTNNKPTFVEELQLLNSAVQ